MATLRVTSSNLLAPAILTGSSIAEAVGKIRPTATITLVDLDGGRSAELLRRIVDGRETCWVVDDCCETFGPFADRAAWVAQLAECLNPA